MTVRVPRVPPFPKTPKNFKRMRKLGATFLVGSCTVPPDLPPKKNHTQPITKEPLQESFLGFQQKIVGQITIRTNNHSKIKEFDAPNVGERKKKFQSPNGPEIGSTNLPEVGVFFQKQAPPRNILQFPPYPPKNRFLFFIIQCVFVVSVVVWSVRSSVGLIEAQQFPPLLDFTLNKNQLNKRPKRWCPGPPAPKFGEFLFFGEKGKKFFFFWGGKIIQSLKKKKEENTEVWEEFRWAGRVRET